MSTCNPSLTITEADVEGLAADIETISQVVESNELTTTTKNGKVIDTLTGRLAQLGFIPPVVYAGSIVFGLTDNVKTIERDGIIYAPLPSSLAFTTSGTWGTPGSGDDADDFFVVQGLTLYGGLVIIPKLSVLNMCGDASLQIGNLVMTQGYYAAGDAGGTFYEVVAAGTGTDDGGQFIDLVAASLQARALFSLANFSVAQYGAVGNGTANDTIPVQNANNVLAISGGGILTFPLVAGGAYRFNLNAQGNIRLQGASRTIELIPAVNAPVVTLRADADVDRFSMELLTINGAATKGSFTSQDGIRSEPDAGFTHSALSLVDCVIKDCGAAGVALIGGNTVGADKLIRRVHLVRTEITGCTLSGLQGRGNVELLNADTCEISNNGKEADIDDSNISFKALGVGVPTEINFNNCGIDTTSYVSGGYSIAFRGVLGASVVGCFFSEYHTAAKLDNVTNGNVVFRDNRFERISGATTALVELDIINGFLWVNNNVAAATTGPVGLSLVGSVTTMLNLSVDPVNSWGGLTAPMDSYPPAIESAGSITLPRHFGMIPISLSADGAANVANLFDEKGGVAQLLHGDTVTVHITNAARTVNLQEGGNLILPSGSDVPLTTITQAYTTRWNLDLQLWVPLQ